MFSLFKKKEDAAPEERLAACLQKKDYAGLARAYYDMGKAALSAGDEGKAMLWFGRADSVYSARDDVYDKVGEKITEDCSDKIGELEEAPLLSNQIEEEIIDQINGMDDAQARVWSLLALARFVPVANRLGTLPGCQVLGRLEKCLDLAVQSFHAESMCG